LHFKKRTVQEKVALLLQRRCTPGEPWTFNLSAVLLCAPPAQQLRMMVHLGETVPKDLPRVEMQWDTLLIEAILMFFCSLISFGIGAATGARRACTLTDTMHPDRQTPCMPPDRQTRQAAMQRCKKMLTAPFQEHALQGGIHSPASGSWLPIFAVRPRPGRTSALARRSRAGLFMAMLVVGAAWGRLVGMATRGLLRAVGLQTAISLEAYTVVGAASTLGECPSLK
jgi:hypothetical protein